MIFHFYILFLFFSIHIYIYIDRMPISTPMMIGAAFLVLVVIIIIAVVATSDNSSGEVVIDEVDAIEEQPKCETHTCPEGYERDDEGFGDTDAECCWPPYCDDSIVCDGNEVVQEGSRGLTKESCCQLPLCTDKVGGICNAEDQKLKNSDIRGVTDDECCDTLPTCSSHVCGPGYKRADDAAERYGNTDGECCVLKTCGENNWGGNQGRKCSVEGMKWDAGNIDVAGNSEDICCQVANCFENEFTDVKCSDPRRGGEYGLTALMPNADSPEEMGKTHDECCATSKCSEPDPIISCDAANGRTMKVPEPYATTEAECCEDIKCSAYFDEYKSSNGGTTGCPENMTPKGGDISGTTQAECCTVKTCSDVDDSCGSGKTLKASERLPTTYPDTFDFDGTCCTDMLCTHPDSPYKAESGCNSGDLDGDLEESIRDVAIDSYALYKPKSNLPDENASQEKCCENKLCSQLTNLDCDKAGKKLNPAARQWVTGDAEGSCCMTKTCADLEGSRTCDGTTKKKTGLGNIDVSPGSNEDADLETAFQTTCCSSKTCADLDVDCGSIEVNGQTNVMEKDSAQDGKSLSGSDCCKWKTCSANGWTDSICKDRTKVRAKYRGSLGIATATGPPPTDSNQPDGKDGQPQAVPNSGTTAGGWSVGDERCCKQDDDNFARQCVAKEYHNGTYKRKSGGVHTSRHMGPILGAQTTGQDANSCMQKCKQNNDCSTFSIDRNGLCVLRPGGDQSTSGTDRLHGGSTLRGVVGIELGGGASAAGGKTRASQYVSMDSFKGWPGSTNHIGINPHMTGKPTVSAADLTRSGSTATQTGVYADDFTNRSGNLTTEADATAWVGRENVLLAGVDEEFCPYDFFQAYEHSSSAHAQPGSDAPSRPTNIGLKSSAQGPSPAVSSQCHELAYGGYGEGPHSISTQKGLNSCYSDPGCAAVWVNTSGTNPWNPNSPANILKHRREDPTSSRIGISANHGLMGSKHHRWTRRMCYKHHLSTQAHVTTPAANLHPGGFLVKTRYKDTRDNKKYIGRAPDKPTFATPFPVESNLLISGDTAV